MHKHIYLFNPWSTALLEKLTASHSKVPATRLFPQPSQSNPYSLFQFLKIHLNIILSSTPGS